MAVTLCEHRYYFTDSSRQHHQPDIQPRFEHTLQMNVNMKARQLSVYTVSVFLACFICLVLFSIEVIGALFSLGEYQSDRHVTTRFLTCTVCYLGCQILSGPDMEAYVFHTVFIN